MAIYTSDLSDENKDKIRNATEISNIIFRESEGLESVTGGTDDNSVESRAIDIYGGKWLYESSGTGRWSTLANSATYKYGTSSGEDGFITCGHG